MKLFFAAPLSGLPSEPIAFGSHASRLHFVRKLVLAAPASSLPSFPTALLAHVPGACAAADPMENAVNKTTSISRVIGRPPLNENMERHKTACGRTARGSNNANPIDAQKKPRPFWAGLLVTVRSRR